MKGISLDEYKRQAAHEVDAIQKRGMSFPAAKEIFKGLNLGNAQGWDGIKNHITETSISNEQATKNLQTLKNFLYEIALFNNKVSSIYNIKKSEFSYLADSLEKISIDSKGIKENFPYNNSTLPTERKDPEPFKIIFRDDSILILFFSVRETLEKKEFDPKKFIASDDPMVNEIATFDKVTAYTKAFTECFDVLKISKSKKSIEILIDQADKTPKKLHSFYCNQIRLKFNDLLKKKSINISLEDNPINLYPKLDTLYSSTDCVVNQLGFTTQNGGRFFGTDKRKNKDLRQVDYHKNGEQADDLTLYFICCAWSKKTDNVFRNIEVTLPGSIRMISGKNANPNLSCAIIEGCLSENDFNFALEKLLG